MKFQAQRIREIESELVDLRLTCAEVVRVMNEQGPLPSCGAPTFSSVRSRGRRSASGTGSAIRGHPCTDSAMQSTGRFLKRLRKKAKRGMRGWPVATIAFYGPDLSRATKVAVGIIPSEDAEPSEMRDWSVETGDVRADVAIAGEILEFIESEGALSIIMTDGVMGCRTSKASITRGNGSISRVRIRHGRDRFTGKPVQNGG